MNLYAVPLIVTLVLVLIEGGFVYASNFRSKTHRIYALLCFSLCVWLFGFSGMYLSKDDTSALFWARNGFLGVIFIPALSYHFVVSLLGVKNDKIRPLLYGASLLLLAVSRSAFIYREVAPRFWGYYPVAGPWFISCLFLFLMGFGGTFARLIAALRKTDLNAKKKNQIKYLLGGFLIAITGIVDYCAAFPRVVVYPWGWLVAFVFITLFALAVVRYDLLDIEVVLVRRTVVFAGLFAFVYGEFSLLMILENEIFKNALHANQWMATIPTVLLITLTLRPIEAFLANITDKFLFQKKYDARQILRAFTNEILTVLDLKELMERTVTDLVKIMKLDSAGILLHNKSRKDYRLAAEIGIRNKGMSFHEGDMLINYLKTSGQPILQDKHTDKMKGEHPLKESFRRLNARLCLPISLHDDFIGILCLGRKKSGEDYTAEDMDILSALARTEAIAISNAQLFNELTKMQAEVMQREKMAVIGTLAAGINHEICNPLSIIRGECEIFLLNYRDLFYKDKSHEEMLQMFLDIMTKVIRETDRAAAITKRLSSFAKPASHFVIEPIAVEKEMEEVLGLMTHDITVKNISIQKKFPKDFPAIYCDRKQLEEVFFNIFRNAIQRSNKTQGFIEVSGSRDEDSAVIFVKDNGVGIPSDKIDHIFNPFFTARESGKATDLGLFIVKQIVDQNKGVISVQSDEKEGVIFTLRFPAQKPGGSAVR